MVKRIKPRESSQRGGGACCRSVNGAGSRYAGSVLKRVKRRKVVKRPDDIPEFASEEEEHRFWSEHRLGGNTTTVATEGWRVSEIGAGHILLGQTCPAVVMSFTIMLLLSLAFLTTKAHAGEGRA